MVDRQGDAAGTADGGADPFRQAIDLCIRALRQRQAPDLGDLTLDAADRARIARLGDLAGDMVSRKQSLMHGIDTLRDGFAVFDDQGALLHANKAFLNFYGTAVRVDIGARFDLLIRAIAAYNLVDLEGLTPDQWAARFDLSQDSSQHVTLFDGRTLRWTFRHNRHGHLVFLGTDISAEVRRQRELEAANRKAEQAVAAKSAFLAHMSHELRTPMNGVIGMAELLCDSGLDPERQRYAETIRNSAEALLSIINDILDYSRGRAGDIHLVERGFDLEAMAIEVATLLQPSARDRGLDLRVMFDPLTPTHWTGDVGRVRQILVNLLGNAVKYTNRGWVRLQVLANDGGVHMLVHDSGLGIPDDRADDIFREFSQLNEPGVSGISGSGLGLAITAQLVEAMGGRLWLSSVEGEGSTFGAILPLRPADPARDAAPPDIAGPGGAPRAAPGRERVVVLQEDRPLSRHLLRMFASAGIPVAMCADREDLSARLSDGPSPRVVMIYCNDDAAETGARIAVVRRLAPRARLFLLVAASRVCAGNARVDEVIALPVDRAGLVRPVARVLSGEAVAPLPAPPPAPPPTEDAADAAWDAAARTAVPVPPPAPSPMPSLATADAPPPAFADPATGARRRRMRVLVADDNATNRLVIEKMLKTCAIDLAMARDGREAFDLWRAARPDLILMDVSMPVMDGREATRMIRRIEAVEDLPRTRIVAVTAAVGETDRGLMLRSGMDEVMTKPVRRAALLEQIARFAPADAPAPVPPADAA